MTRYGLIVGVIEIIDEGCRVFAPYGAKDDIKLIPGRRFDPARKCWVVPAHRANEARDAIRSYVDDIETVDLRSRRRTRRARPAGGDGFDALFRALPPRLRKPAYRALAKVLHPDTGGDTAATQALTTAWEKTK